jgi:ketosteroid isomerase-like protein
VTLIEVLVNRVPNSGFRISLNAVMGSVSVKQPFQLQPYEVARESKTEATDKERTMKIWLILTLSALGAATGFGGTPKPDARNAVLAAERAFVDAMTKPDKAVLEKLLADDLVYVHSSSKVETKAEVIHVVTSGSTVYESIEFRDTTVRQYGDVVVTTHKAAIKTKQAGLANLLVTHVWAKHKGGWHFASRHASRLPE